jgi:hypothetical protein
MTTNGFKTRQRAQRCITVGRSLEQVRGESIRWARTESFHQRVWPDLTILHHYDLDLR